MAVDDDLSQSEKKMTATEGNVASSSHSPGKTRTASAPAGDNKAETAEEAKETPGKMEPSAAEGEEVVSIKKNSRSSAPAGDFLPESMADDELCQSENKVTTTPLGEGNVLSSHCSSAKTSTGSAPAGETKPETVQEAKGTPGESNLSVAEGEKMISKKVTTTSSTGSAPAGETEPETVQEVKETPGESNQGVGEGEEVISTKKVTKTSTVSAPAGETEPETVQEATETTEESKPVIDGEAEAQNVNESKETPEFVSGGGADEDPECEESKTETSSSIGADQKEDLGKSAEDLGYDMCRGFEFIESCEESKTETSSPIGEDKKEDLGKSAEDLGYDMCRDIPTGADKKKELSHVYLLHKLPNEDKKGMLVYRHVDEQAGRVQYVTTPCEIKGNSKMCNRWFTYVHPKREWAKSEEETQQGPSLWSRILRAAESAKRKQEEIEKSYPKVFKYGKYIFKTAVGFPAYLVVDLPEIYNSVADFCKTLKLPKEQREKKLGEKALNVAMWALSSVAGYRLKMIGMPFVWDKEVIREMTETVWEKEVSVSSEESEAKVEREEDTKVGGKEEDNKVGGKEEDTKVEEEDGMLLVDVMVEDGTTVVYVFSVCDENEEVKNDEDFSEYFLGLLQSVEIPEEDSNQD